MNKRIISEEFFVARYGSVYPHRSLRSILNKYRNAVSRFGMETGAAAAHNEPQIVKIYVCALNGTVEVFDVPVGLQQDEFWKQIAERFQVMGIHNVTFASGENNFPGEEGIKEEHNNEIVHVLFQSANFKNGVYVGGCLTYHQLISVQEFPTSQEELPMLMITYYEAPTQHHPSKVKTDFMQIHTNVHVDESENLFHVVASRELFEGIELDKKVSSHHNIVPEIVVSSDGKCIAWVTQKSLYFMRTDTIENVMHSTIHQIPFTSQKSILLTGMALLDQQFALVNVSYLNFVDLFIYDLFTQKKVLTRRIKNDPQLIDLYSYKVTKNIVYDSVSNGYAYGKLFVTMNAIRNAITSDKKIPDIPFELLVDGQRLVEPLKYYPEIVKVKTFNEGRTIFNDSLIAEGVEFTQHSHHIKRMPMNVISPELSTRAQDVYIYSSIDADAMDYEYVIRTNNGTLDDRTLVHESGLFIVINDLHHVCILLPEVQSEEARTYRSLLFKHAKSTPIETDNQVIVEGTEATLLVRPRLQRTELET